MHKKLNFVLLKQHIDEDGRLLCVEAIVNGMKLNLCNIYARNVEDAHFFHKANKLLGGIVDGHTVMGGDFNQIQDNVLDRTTYSKTVPKDRQGLPPRCLLLNDI